MIYDFHTKRPPVLGQVGGKAKALIESSRAGFPVPNGVVLSVAFFQEWLTTIKSSDEWHTFLQATTKKNCDKIVEKAKHLTFTPRQSTELNKHLTHLSGNLFSVRSSSPEEDLEGTSFAGMYETHLGVRKETLEAFIAKTFASCFDFRVMKYKQQNHISLDNTAIAVIVQQQIESDVSGVAFSLNPLNNAYDEVVINAAFGLGEAIVSGIVTPDTYVVDKINNTIIEKKIAAKDIAVRLGNQGDISQEKNSQPSEQALSDEQIIALSHLVCRVEEHYGKPMDTEWAIADGTLYLLQARPITTYIPLFPEMLTKPGETKALYMDFIVVTQGFSEPLSEMGLDIWAKMVQIGNGFPRGKDGILWAIHGRHYMVMSNLMKVSPTLSKTFSSHDAPTKQIFAHLNKKEFTPAKTPKKLKGFLWKMMLFMFSLYGKSTLKGVFNSQAMLNDYEKASDKVWRHFYEKLTKNDASFEALVNESLNGFSMLVKEVGGVLVAANLAKWRIQRMFKKHEDAKDLIVSLAMNVPNNPVAQMGDLMLKIAVFPEFIATQTAEEFATKLKTQTYSAEFFAVYNEYLEKFACRGVKEIDIATPRMSENTAEIFTALKQIDIEDNATLNVKKRSEEAYDKLYTMAQAMGKAKQFVKLAKTYRNMIGYRDHPKYMYVVAVSLLRKQALHLGEKWVNEGRLENAEQVFSLSVAEVAQAERDSQLPLMPIIAKNTAPYQSVAHIKDWASIIDSRGKIYRAYPKSKAGEMVGEPIAPGVVTGKAKVLLSPYEKPLNKGDILICKASEPSWAPVFINASGVVMEVGGPLQHGAIIAREYGLPCVSSVYDATKIIKDGDLIEVDGSNGLIRILANH